MLDHNLVCTAGLVSGAHRNSDLERRAAWAATADIDYIENDAASALTSARRFLLSRKGSPRCAAIGAVSGGTNRH